MYFPQNIYRWKPFSKKKTTCIYYYVENKNKKVIFTAYKNVIFSPYYGCLAQHEKMF